MTGFGSSAFRSLQAASFLALALAGCPSSSPPVIDDPDPGKDAGSDSGDRDIADDGYRDPGPADDDGRPDDPGGEDPSGGDAPDLPDASDAGDVPDGPSVWGWISAIETNDTCDQWYQKTQWFGGVRAYFATAPEFNRALPHTLQFATRKATVGACSLYDPGIMTEDCPADQCLCLDKGVECSMQDGSRWCPEDQVCVKKPDYQPGVYDPGICVPLPAHFDAGTVTIGGLKSAVVMAPDSLDRYKATPSDPNDLFDAGDVLTATTGGGDLPPMSFTARGVAPLAIPTSDVSVVQGRSSTIRWTPADPPSRVQVVLEVGSHDPNPLGGAIVCDAPDADGEVVVDGTLLDELIHLSCDGAWMLKCSRITRYSRDVKSMGGQDVEFFAGSARNLRILRE